MYTANATSPHTQGLTVVGDDDQCIYAFRGAEVIRTEAAPKPHTVGRTPAHSSPLPQVGNFGRLSRVLAVGGRGEATPLLLEANYRCSRRILDLGTRIIRGAHLREPKALRATRGRGD